MTDYPGLDERTALVAAKYPFLSRQQARTIASVAIRPECHNNGVHIGFDAKDRPVFATGLEHATLARLLEENTLPLHAICKNGNTAGVTKPIRRVPVLAHPFLSTLREHARRPWTVRVLEPNDEIVFYRFAEVDQALHFVEHYGHPTEPSTSPQLGTHQAEPSFRKARAA